jgi:D-alanyl-D-alanine carboxypeptidase
MSDRSPKKQLEDFRYDARLFNQAYKAGLKAKELEKEEKRKKQYKIFFTIIGSIIIFISILYLLRSPLFNKPNYLKNNALSNQEFSKVIDNIQPSPNPQIKFEDNFVNAKSALYANLNTGEILYQKNINEELQIASLTKLISAIVALKEFELEDTVEVKQDWYDMEDMSWSIGFDKGDTVTVETLLNAMLISSYNDASYVLADNIEGGWEKFVEKMNDYINKIGLEYTEFSNPSGLENNGGNKSTVAELYKLSTIIYKNDFIMDTLSKGYADVNWNIGSERIYTTNSLLRQYGNIAGKTGYTEEAGGCFLGITDEGYVTIVLGSSQRFEDTQKLLTNLNSEKSGS